MKYVVNLTDKAKGDLKSIFEYIAYNLLSFETAIKQLERIETAVYSLEEMPERCRIYEYEPWKSRNVRVMVVDRYLIFYIVDKSNKRVDTMRILYGGRNTENVE